MAQFRKKPVVIDAMLWTGSNFEEMNAFLGGQHGFDDKTGHAGRVVILTLEGTMQGEPGDWIIRGIKGEYYPCKPDIFEATYEAMEVLA